MHLGKTPSIIILSSWLEEACEIAYKAAKTCQIKGSEIDGIGERPIFVNPQIMNLIQVTGSLQRGKEPF